MWNNQLYYCFIGCSITGNQYKSAHGGLQYLIGRGYQLKYGTEHATGEYLMFLHADTMVPEKFDLAINKCLQKPGNVAGAFKFSLDILEIPEILRLVIYN